MRGGDGGEAGGEEFLAAGLFGEALVFGGGEEGGEGGGAAVWGVRVVRGAFAFGEIAGGGGGSVLLVRWRRVGEPSVVSRVAVLSCDVGTGA